MSLPTSSAAKMAPERPAHRRGLRADEPGSSDARADDGAGTASQQMDEGQGGALLAARAGNPRKRPVAVTSDEELWTRCTAMRRVSHAAEAEARHLDVPPDLASATASSSRGVDSELMPPPPPRPPAPVAASAAHFDLSVLRKRAETMLLGTGERSVASGIAAVASEGTYGLVIAVRGAASKLWDDRQDEIKAACARGSTDFCGCQGGGSSGGDGSSVCAGAAAGVASRAAGGGCARARSGVSGGCLQQEPSSSRSSSRGGGGLKKVPLAACGGGYEACAAGELLEPPGCVVERRRESFRRSLRCDARFHGKKLGLSHAVLSRYACVHARPVCISDAPNSAVHVGMSHVCVASLTKNHLTG